MDPDVVLCLTGFPVDTSLAVLGFIRNMCNVQGNSFAASMPPLIAAMLSMKKRDVKVIHLDILNEAFNWDKCEEDDPWSDYEEDMEDFANLIMDCGFASIFSAGHLATDRLRKLSSTEVGISKGLSQDRHAFTLRNAANTLVFTAYHPQVRPLAAEHPTPPLSPSISSHLVQNLLKTWTGAACMNAGNWDRSIDGLVHYMGGKFQRGVGPVFEFVSRCEDFAFTESALDLAIRVRALEL
jgi:hypothetical protein